MKIIAFNVTHYTSYLRMQQILFVNYAQPLYLTVMYVTLQIIAFNVHRVIFYHQINNLVTFVLNILRVVSTVRAYQNAFYVILNTLF